MIHRKFRLEVINILNITRYATKNECLIPWVKFFWHIEAANADIHYKLLPTDCIDVILNLADDVVYETECNKIIAPLFISMDYVVSTVLSIKKKPFVFLVYHFILMGYIPLCINHLRKFKTKWLI